MIGYLISQASFSVIFLAALLAQVIVGKVDKISHMLGFGIAIISSFLLGLPPIEYAPLAIFVIAGALDELTLLGFWKFFTEYRLFLKIAALAFAVIGRFDYFIAIVLFDGGYLVAELLSS